MNKYFLILPVIALIIGNINVQADQICQFDPSMGLPNPLGGMKSFVTIKEKPLVSGLYETKIIFERLPEDLPSNSLPGEIVKISETSDLLFLNMNIAQVRNSMLKNKDYFRLLTSDKDPKGFSKINETLTCHAVTLKEIETTLNRYYEKVIGKLHDKDKQLLIEVQANWLKYRDFNCELEQKQVQKVQFADAIQNSCLVRLTEVRIKELSHIYYMIPSN